MPAAAKKPTIKKKKIVQPEFVTLSRYEELRDHVIEHSMQNKMQFEAMTERMDKLTQSQEKLLESLNTIIENQKQPIMVTVTNGTTKDIPLSEAMSYVWESTYLLREGKTLVSFWHRNKKFLVKFGALIASIVGLTTIGNYKTQIFGFLKALVGLIS